MIPCKQDDGIVDWSSGVLKTNVGESKSGTREEEMLGEYFVLPPGTPPSSQWRVLEDFAVVPGGNSVGLPSMVMKPTRNLVPGRDPD